MKIETNPPVPTFDFIITLTLAEFNALQHLLYNLSETRATEDLGITKEEYTITSDLWSLMNGMSTKHGL